MEHRPERRLLTIWRILLTSLVFLPAFAISLFLKPPGALWLALTAVWVLFFLLMYTVFLPMSYRAMSFRLDGNTLIQRGGVFNSFTRSLPCENIQYIVLASSPLDRAFAIRSLILVAPGGKMIIRGLGEKKAEDLMKTLSAEGNHV